MLALTLLLIFAGSAWAEYCTVQGNPRVPKNQVANFDWRAFLSVVGGKVGLSRCVVKTTETQ